MSLTMVPFPKEFRSSFVVTAAEENRFRNSFFYPNMCHFCYTLESEDIILRRCTGCEMISYCCRLHQQADWMRHKDLCRVISNLLKNYESTNLFGFVKTIVDPVQRLKKKRALIALVSKKLKRCLSDSEQLMFLFPRVCEVCSESNPASLLNCSSCPHGCFCLNHKDDTDGHAALCPLNNLSFCVDWTRFPLREFFRTERIVCDEVPFVENNFNLPENMEEFLKTQPVGKFNTFVISNLWPVLSAEFYTKSLTLLYAMEKLNLKVGKELVVHVIGVPDWELDYNFTNLEVLLHLMPQLKTLRVSIINSTLFKGPEGSEPSDYPCQFCTERKKTFILEKVELPYATFVNRKSFVRPNIVISYDDRDFESRLWSESILKIKKIQAPLVITKNSESRAVRSHQKITELIGLNFSNNRYFGKNPFASHKPIRDTYDDEMGFANNYVMIYSLHDVEREKESTKKKNRRGHCDEEFPDFIQEEEREARLRKLSERRNGTVQKVSESTDDSDKVINSQNSQKSTDEDPDKKDGGEGKSKKKKKKKKKAKNSDEGKENETDRITKQNSDSEKQAQVAVVENSEKHLKKPLCDSSGNEKSTSKLPDSVIKFIGKAESKKQLVDSVDGSEADSKTEENSERSQDDEFTDEAPESEEQKKDSGESKTQDSANQNLNSTSDENKTGEKQGPTKKKGSDTSKQNGSLKPKKWTGQENGGIDQSKSENQLSISSEEKAGDSQEKSDSSNQNVEGQEAGDQKSKKKKKKNKRSKNQVTDSELSRPNPTVPETNAETSCSPTNGELVTVSAEEVDFFQQRMNQLLALGGDALNKRANELIYENEHMEELTVSLTSQYIELKSNSRHLCRTILREITALKYTLIELEDKLKPLTMDDDV